MLRAHIHLSRSSSACGAGPKLPYLPTRPSRPSPATRADPVFLEQFVCIVDGRGRGRAQGAFGAAIGTEHALMWRGVQVDVNHKEGLEA